MQAREPSQSTSDGAAVPPAGANAPVRTSADRGAIAGIAGACLAGAWIRGSGLSRQILIDDEFHAFRAGLRRDLDAMYLFTHNTLPEDGLSDFSSPLALWVRFLTSTVGIDEWSLRAPLWLASVALVVVLGAVGLRTGRPRIGLLAAWLAAASPLLVVFARFARPYALVALCGALALWAADVFRTRPSLRSAVGLGAACAFGVWFNASAIPALAVLGWLGLAPALRGRLGDEARRNAWMGAAVAAVLGALLVGPSAASLSAFVAAKGQSAPASWSAWAQAFQALAGSRFAGVTGLFFALATVGAVVLFRSATSLAGLGAAALTAQLGAFLLLRPYGGDEPLVIARYAIATLPALLLFVAAGLDAAARVVPSAVVGSVLTGVVLGASIVLGPLPEPLLRENAFTSRPSNLVGSAVDINDAAVPAFYTRLAARAGDAEPVLAELPWVLEWPLAIVADYQRIHGREVRTATGFWTFRDPAVHFGSQLRWSGGELDLAGIDYAIVHLDWVREWAQLTGAPLSMDPDRLAEAAQRYRIDAAALDRWLAAQRNWELDYEDKDLRVYKRKG